MGTKTHQQPEPAPSYVVTTEAGLVAVLRRDQDRATVVELGDGILRVRLLERDGRTWRVLADAELALDAPTVSPLDPDDVPCVGLLCEAA